MKLDSSTATTEKKHIDIKKKGKYASEYHSIDPPVTTLKPINNRKKGIKYDVCPNALNKISDINEPK